MSTITPNLTAGMSRSTAISRMREMARAKVGDTSANALTTLGALRDVLNVDAPAEYSIYNYEPGSTARAKVNAYHNSVSRISMFNYIFDQSIGLFIDPSDLLTLFQNAAGSIPVTAPGQTVGLALDKSRNLTLGLALSSTNVRAFISAGGAADSSLINHGDGTYTVASGSTLRFVFGPAADVFNKTYKITIDHVAGTTSNITYDWMDSADSANTKTSTPGTSHTFYGRVSSGTFEGAHADVSNSTGSPQRFRIPVVREIPGNHATQSTLGSRPLYATLPASGVRNLATGSASPASSDWVSSATQNGITFTRVATGLDTDGLPYADYSVVGTASANAFFEPLNVTTQRVPALVGQTYTTSMIARVISGTPPQVGDGFTAYVRGETAPSTITETSTLNYVGPTTDTVISTSFTPVNAATNQVRSSPSIRVSTSAVVNYIVRLKGYQFERGSTRTAYQFNYSTVNIAEPPYAQVGALKFDGSNDFLVTPSIDFSATDKMTVFAGVRKLSDAALGSVAELSVSSAANNGTWHLIAPGGVGTATYYFGSKGTTAQGLQTPSSYTAPITNVLTVIGDISGDSATTRVNGTQVQQDTGDQGTGNYGNYPIYIGMRAGTSIPFNGYLYNLIVVGKTLTSDQVYAIENYVNSKTGAY